MEGEGKQVLVGICAMAKKSQSKPMKEILTRLEEFEYIKIIVFPEEVILKVIHIYVTELYYNSILLTTEIYIFCVFSFIGTCRKLACGRLFDKFS